MPSGPSREELKNYFNNSRQYFDELAKHYRETDPEYYNEYIAPFYGPFSSVKSGKSPKIILVIAFLMVILIGGASFLVMFMTSNKDDAENNEKYDKPKVTESPEKEKGNEISDYERGLNYYKKGDHTSAEKYFRRVPASDRNYKDAQKKLAEIKSMKSKEESDPRSLKPKPKERVN